VSVPFCSRVGKFAQPENDEKLECDDVPGFSYPAPSLEDVVRETKEPAAREAPETQLREGPAKVLRQAMLRLFGTNGFGWIGEHYTYAFQRAAA